MLRRLRFLAVVASLAALAGCASTGSVPDIPSGLVNSGLLVARLYVPGTLAWENAQINIDGKLYGSNVRDGYVGIALPPGQHHFVQLRVEGRQLSSTQSHEARFRQVRGGGYRAPTYTYTPGSTYVTYYTTLAVDRKFMIEESKVTNLGLLVYLPVSPPAGAASSAPAGQGKRFQVVAVDNNAEMKTYLETNYPVLMSSIGEQSLQLAPGKYLDIARLPELRRAIAASEFKSGKVVTNATATVAYGDAGTLVMLRRTAGGQLGKAEVLNTGTLADIVDAVRDDERMLFLTSEGKLLSVDDGKLAVAGVPFRVHAVRLAAFSDGGLAIIDNRLRVLRSRDRGATWIRHENAMIDTPRNDIGIAGDVDNLYITLGTRGIPSRILNLRVGDAAPALIDPPSGGGAKAAGRSLLVSREAGLFLMLSGQDFYFRPQSGDRWQQQSMPGQKCKPVVFDQTGRKLGVECDGIKYESGDSGQNWSKLSV